MKPPSEWKIPEWCDGLPDSTILKAGDVAKAFGCHQMVAANHRSELIPKPDFKGPIQGQKNALKTRQRNICIHPTNYWRLGTIRKWIRERQS